MGGRANDTREPEWEVCPKCGNMDGGCPFCGHGYIHTEYGAAKAIMEENAEKRGRSRSDAARVHWLAERFLTLASVLADIEAECERRAAIGGISSAFIRRVLADSRNATYRSDG